MLVSSTAVDFHSIDVERTNLFPIQKLSSYFSSSCFFLCHSRSAGQVITHAVKADARQARPFRTFFSTLFASLVYFASRT